MTLAIYTSEFLELKNKKKKNLFEIIQFSGFLRGYVKTTASRQYNIEKKKMKSYLLMK